MSKIPSEDGGEMGTTDTGIAPEAEMASKASRKHADDSIRDVRRVGISALAVSLLALASVVSIVFSYQSSQSADSAATSAQAVVESNAAAACRAAFNAVITDARVTRESDTAMVITLLARGLRATVVSDDAEAEILLVDLSNRLDVALEELAESGVSVETANNLYQEVVQAQLGDPDLFQALCDAGPVPIGGQDGDDTAGN